MVNLHITTVIIVSACLLLFLVYGCSGGGGDKLSETDQAIVTLATAATSASLTAAGGGISTRAEAIPSLPAVHTLIAAGTAATPKIIAKYSGIPSMTQDDALLAYAYVLSVTQDCRAIRSLIDFLSVNITGEVQWSLHGATRTLKILTDQNDINNNPPTYTPLEMLDTMTRAEAWLTAHPSAAAEQISVRSRAATASTASGCVRIYLTNAQGVPFYWANNHKAGAMTKVEFDLHIYRDPRVPSSTDLVWAIPRYGGTFLATNEGSEALMGRLGICGGYALREMLRFGGSATPQGGWGLDPLQVFNQLNDAGLITIVSNPSNAKAGDMVFWKKGSRSATHAAIIQSVPPTTSTIQVRNKDETSGVFTASINATYYNTGTTEKIEKNFGTPVIYTYTGNEVPKMMVDTTLSGTKTPAGGEVYLQNVTVVVK